jgi:hypothetical protein
MKNDTANLERFDSKTVASGRESDERRNLHRPHPALRRRTRRAFFALERRAATHEGQLQPSKGRFIHPTSSAMRAADLCLADTRIRFFSRHRPQRICHSLQSSPGVIMPVLGMRLLCNIHAEIGRNTKTVAAGAEPSVQRHSPIHMWQSQFEMPGSNLVSRGSISTPPDKTKRPRHSTTNQSCPQQLVSVEAVTSFRAMQAFQARVLQADQFGRTILLE